MVSVNLVPFCKTGFYALDVRWVVPVPGLTGTPSLRFALTTPEAGYKSDQDAGSCSLSIDEENPWILVRTVVQFPGHR